MVKSTNAPKRLRSAKAPLMSAGVMAANIIWKVAKSTNGMPFAPSKRLAGLHADAVEEGVVEAADDAQAADRRGEGEAEADDHPDDGDDRQPEEAVHDRGEHVLGAHEAAIEERQARAA